MSRNLMRNSKVSKVLVVLSWVNLKIIRLSLKITGSSRRSADPQLRVKRIFVDLAAVQMHGLLLHQRRQLAFAGAGRFVVNVPQPVSDLMVDHHRAIVACHRSNGRR